MLSCDSFEELEFLDLVYGGQLAACERWAKQVVAQRGGFAWGNSATRAALALDLETMEERVTALDIADLLTKYARH